MNDEQYESTPRRSSMLLGVGLALLLAASAFFSGLYLGTAGSQLFASDGMEAGLWSWLLGSNRADSVDDADLEEFWRVWRLLEDKFVAGAADDISVETRLDGAIEGLVESYGDPYTVFLPPKESAAFEESISGNFSGIGMEVGMQDGVITVIAPLSGTPAERAGILPGDAIVSIGGTSTESLNVDEAVEMIRGDEGTTITLTLFRKGGSELFDVTMTREVITIPTSKTEHRGDVFIITLYNFNALAERQMEQAVREFEKSGAQKLVLDLRGNPGGYLESANAIASLFLPAGKVIVRENFGDEREEVIYRSQGRTGRSYTKDNLVVLVDGGSASASEILAGALKEHEAATIIGSKTFGKGSVQELIALPDGSALKVTIARWFTPNGHSISDGGLEPTVSVERTVEDREAKRDPQLDAGVAWLGGKRDF